MRTAIQTFLQAAGRHFSVVPVTPLSNAGAALAHPIQPEPQMQTKDHPVNKNRRFPPAAMAAPGLSRADISSACVIHRDADVRRSATWLLSVLQRQLEGALLGLIAESINRADGPLAETTPAEVTKQLDAMATEVEHELAQAREETAAHDRTRRQHDDITWPLREAVSTRLTAAVVECDHLLGRIAANENSAGREHPDRSRQLAALGLSHEQILVVEPSAGPTVWAMRERIDALNAEIAQLTSFSADPFLDAERLAGLGFDAIVEAQRAAFAVVPS